MLRIKSTFSFNDGQMATAEIKAEAYDDIATISYSGSHDRLLNKPEKFPAGAFENYSKILAKDSGAAVKTEFEGHSDNMGAI
jgi:hypothetical protein